MTSIALVAAAYGGATLAATLAHAARDARPARADRTSVQAACALAAAVVGAVLAGRGLALEPIAIAGVVTVLLGAVAAAGFCADGVPTDVVCGGLAIVLAAALVHGRAAPLIGAAVAGSPFVITSLLLPNNRGSLRDGAVAAIGGSLLGVPYGIATTIVGTIAGALAFSRNPAGTRSFAPYLACAIGLGIAAFALFAL